MATQVCRSYGCNNTPKRGYNRCTPCYRGYLYNSSSSYSSSSYSSTSSTGSSDGLIYIVVALAVLALTYWVGMGVWHFINGVWHSLPTVDEASMTCEVTGGLLGMVCSY